MASSKPYLAALSDVMRTPSGRRVVWEWLSRSGVFRQTYTRGDPVETAYKEGQRSLGLLLGIDVLNEQPELTTTMWRENQASEPKPTEESNG